MDQEMRQPGVGSAGNTVLTGIEIDTIGEILNISMGSAATAISTMLDQKVVISTPNVEVRGFSSLDYSELEPSMLVKIKYVEGLAGSNVMIFRQRDMQVILGLLMGDDSPPSDDFVFDELSISAACEVMNQMMGASATALSEFLSRSVNISTPEAVTVTSRDAYEAAIGVHEGQEIVSVSFRLTIDGVMDSNFVSVMTIEFAKGLISQVIQDQEAAAPPRPAPAPEPPQPAPPAPEPELPQMAPPPVAEQTPPQMAPPPVAEQAPPQMAPPLPDMNQLISDLPPVEPSVLDQIFGGAPAVAGEPLQQPGIPYAPEAPVVQETAAPAYGAPQPAPVPAEPGYGVPPAAPPAYGAAVAGQSPYGYAPPQTQREEANYQMSSVMKQGPVNVQNTQFPQFAPQQTKTPASAGNMDLLMRVSLDVSVEIGKAKRKIKDIVEFGQGTVIELNKQAGAPVDIVVNGCLLARGDVVVIDDNFGVRITEIVGAKELMDSLKEENGF